MPYIKQETKQKFEPELSRLENKLKGASKGELTYVIYKLGLAYFKNKPDYTNISSSISSLIDAAEEIRRRVLNPYEDRKRRENGDA